MENKNIEELIPLIFTLNRLVREQIAWHWKMDPLSLVQLKILSLILEKGTPTMKEIANSLYITLPSATSAIDRLVKDWQLKRITDENDRRIVRLKIIPKGEEIYNKHHKDIFKRMNEILIELNEKEIMDFTNILTKIINSHKK